MLVLSNFYHDIYETECRFFEQDEEYQAAKDKRNELEKNLVMGLTRKQRILFHEYRAQQDVLANMELHRLFSHCSILLSPKGK